MKGEQKMKVYTVRVTKRNHQFVAVCRVLENAIDAYKAYVQRSYKNPLLFEVWDSREETDPNGSGIILAYTESGFNYNVRVRA